MLKERHRYEVSAAAATSSRRRPCWDRSGAVPEVGLIPGNRFLLLPLKKVTALVRPHTPCREPSATSTKPCITSRRAHQAAVHSSSGNSNNIQTVARSRHRRSHHRVAKAHLSPVSEHHEPLLDQQQLGLPRTRSRDTSIFTLSVEQAQLWRRSSNGDLVRYRKPAAAGSRNNNINRVAPNYYPDLRSWSSFTDKVVSSNYHGDLRSGGDQKLGVSRQKRNSVAQHIRATSPFLCSFTNENDLPFGPSPLHRRSGRSS